MLEEEHSFVHSLLIGQGHTYFWQLFFAEWAMWIMVKAALKAFEAKGVSTGSGNRFIEQPEHENMEQKSSAAHRDKADSQTVEKSD